MATPFLRAVRTRFASAQITLLLQAHHHELLRGGDWMDDCIQWPPRRRSKPWHLEYRTFVREIRSERFDLAILLPNSFRAALLTWQARAKRRVGYNRDGRGVLLTDRLPVRNRVRGRCEPLPLVEYYADLAEFLGCERPDDALELFSTTDCEEAVGLRLGAAGLAEGCPIVVICPGAKFGASKCWPPERFAAVADRLVERHGAAVVVSPGPGEEGIARAIAAEMQHVPIVIDNPCLTLGELKSLVSCSDLLLGNDTGPRHFARALNVPMVTVFGPTDPAWTATSYSKERIVRVDVDCGPCHKKVCPLGHLKCMTLVTVDMVERACERMLGLSLPETPSAPKTRFSGTSVAIRI
jgi:heptosyltransferase-2